MSGHVIVCGLGHVGACTVDVLRKLGIGVVVVDKSPEPALRAMAEESGASIIQTDMRSPDAMRLAGIETARALVVSTSDDALNVDVLLRVQRIRPQLRVVFRLADDRLARRLQESLPSAIGLTVPELASPAFAFATGSDAITRALVVGDRHWAVAEVDLTRARVSLDSADAPTLLEARGPWGARALPPELPPDATAATIAGPWERVLGALGTAQPWPAWHPGLLRRAAAAARSVRHALWVVAGLALIAIALNALYFAALLGIPLPDAIYFVTTTLTTVGYGDISLLKEPEGVKLYASGLMLVGTLMTAILTALVTEHVIGQRRERVLGARPLPQSGHIVVVGLGTVGMRAVTILRRLGAPVAVVDRRARGSLADRVRALGVPVIEGDASAPTTLAAARAERASCVLVVTSDDMANLGIALAVRELSQKQHVVLRLFDRELAGRVRTALSMPATRSAAELAAPAMAARAAFGPHALDAIVLGERPYAVWSQKVSRAEGLHTVESVLPHGSRALFLRGIDAEVAVPNGATRVEAGDVLISLRPAADIAGHDPETSAALPTAAFVEGT